MSDIRANTISDAAGTGPTDLYKQSAAKVWCALGSNNTLAQSFNISSIADVGAGIVGYSYSSNMANAINAITVGADDNNYGNRACFVSGDSSVSGTRTVFIEGNSTTVEDDWVNISVFGDLA